MKKYKIIRDREFINSNEIAKTKDFQAVLKGATLFSTSIFKTKWFRANSFAALITFGIFIIYFTIYKELGKKNNYINPPIKNVNIPFVPYSIHTNEDQSIKLKSGTRVDIPRFSFITKGGDSVNGIVVIKIREIRDKHDIFLSGIPMEYDSAGINGTFESAGMIELKGNQQGKEIFIAPNKVISIQLQSNYSGNDYNLYQLDTIRRNWKYKGKDSVTIYPPLKKGAKNSKHQSVSTPKRLQKKEQKLANIQNEITQLKKQEPVKPTKAKSGKWRFGIKVSPEEFPEIAMYKNTLWEVDESKQKFDPANSKIHWEDVLINKVNDKHNYLIIFRKGTLEIKYNAIPVFEGRDYDNALKIYVRKYSEYKQKLNNRKNTEQKLKTEIHEKRQQWLKEIEEERRRENERRRQLQTQRKIMRSFTIDNFGIWNCDKIVKNSTPISISTLFTDSSGQALTLNTVYVVNDSLNAIFSMNQEYNENLEGYYKITFESNAKNMIWSVTKENTLAVIPFDQFKAIFSGDTNKIKVEMKIINAEINTPEDFTNLYDKNFTK